MIRRAQAILIAKGLPRVERGRGTFVAGFGEQSREQLIDELDRASQEPGAAQGLDNSSRASGSFMTVASTVLGARRGNPSTHKFEA